MHREVSLHRVSGPDTPDRSARTQCGHYHGVDMDNGDSEMAAQLHRGTYRGQMLVMGNGRREVRTWDSSCFVLFFYNPEADEVQQCRWQSHT